MLNFFKYLVLFFFLSVNQLFSQETEASIELINFNSVVNYAPGSGVSVHIDPKGVYKFSDLFVDGEISDTEISSSENNSFILELIDSNDNLIQQLSEVNDFYTPLINGDLPSDLAAGTYRLRISATHAKIFEEVDEDGDGDTDAIIDTQTNTTVSVITNEFNVIGNAIENDIFILSPLTNEISANAFECISSNSNRVNPQFGALSVQQNTGTYQFQEDNGGSEGFESLNFAISNFNSSNNYTVNLINIGNGSVTELNAIVDGVYQIPSLTEDTDLNVGTYTIEIEEVNNNISNFFSAIFLWHSNATPINNATADQICVGAEVVFNISNSNSGIGQAAFLYILTLEIIQIH